MLRTRRTLTVAILAGLALTGCSGGTDEADGPESSAADGAFPVTIEHRYGTTEITERPERVLTVGAIDHDTVLALGVTPVAVTDWVVPPLDRPWNAELVENPDDVTVLNGEETDFEAIAGQEPDLIIALWSAISESDYDLLSGIAPTVASSADYPEFGMPWDLTTSTIATALGVADEGAALIESTETAIDDAIAANPSLAGATGVIAYDFGGGQLGAYTDDDVRAQFLARLGLVPPPGIVGAGTGGFAALSLETLNLLDGDVVCWITLPASTLATDEIYLGREMVAQGRDIFLSEDAGIAISYNSVLSLPWVLEEIVPQLVAAIDGDPATAIPGS